MNDLSTLIQSLLEQKQIEQRQLLFSQVVERMQDMAFGIAYGVLGDVHLAEDAAQEAFMTAWSEFSSLREADAFPLWLKRIVLTQCNRLTRRKRLNTVVLEESSGSTNGQGEPEVIAEQTELALQLRDALEQLPEHERVTAILYYGNDLSYADISSTLEIPVSTVKKRMFSARKHMKVFLENELRESLNHLLPSRDNRFVEMVRFLLASGVHARQHEDGLHLTHKSNKAFAVTPDHYKVPLRMIAVLKTDSYDTRLRFARDQIILNWHGNPSILKWGDPAEGKTTDVPGRGALPRNEWVHIELIIENDYAELLVNKESRYRHVGDYQGLAGQLGIGPAHGSTLTVKSFTVIGERVQDGIRIMPPPRFDWDGGYIYVRWSNHESAVDWYCRFLGLTTPYGTWNSKNDPATVAEKKTHLTFGSKGAINLKSVHPDIRSQHYYAEWDKDAGVYYRFATLNLYAEYEFFQKCGIEVSHLYTGPDGCPSFNFRDPDGIFHTVTHRPDYDYGGSRFIYDSWVTEVTDLEDSINWYKRNLNLPVQRSCINEGWVLLAGNILLTSSWAKEEREMISGASQPYFLVREIAQEYNRLSRNGVTVSPLITNEKGSWSAFHFFDPDGNRINVWRY
ncbi:sigma-70 family RNA polymerase sigma factor [Paenibacillus mesophilus]|uniref:sigma-70 family RNA polymerase sigma factor n=1 Tax=Paenibacillus mesophilus TaxID=2582849 RepID=UPI00110DA683|nr:sigma-70 family RNA polymerase sigma factor [Paenibacillus mesophilus]TMV43897.1 sigma-70 family RNA polymerase sigma factor [Paenibacillus mesophilus]